MSTQYGRMFGIATIVGTFAVAGIGSFAVTKALATPAAGAEQAGPGPGHGRGFGMRGGGPMGLLGSGFGQLDLTDGQRDGIRAIMEQQRTQFAAVGERMREARRALHEATATSPMNEDLIRQRSAEVAAVEADAAVLRARVAQDIQGLLTPEQQARLQELRAERQKRMGERRQRFEERRLRRQPPAGELQPQMFRAPAHESNRQATTFV